MVILETHIFKGDKILGLYIKQALSWTAIKNSTSHYGGTSHNQAQTTIHSRQVRKSPDIKKRFLNISVFHSDVIWVDGKYDTSSCSNQMPIKEASVKSWAISLKKRNRHGHVRYSLVLNLDWSVWLLFPWAYAHNKRTSSALKPKGADKRARPCIFYIEDLGFCPSWWQVYVPMQDIFIVSLQAFLPPCRSETRHVRYCAALLVFFICSYVGKFCFKIVNTISLQALRFYEGANETDKCYSCSWICLSSFPLSALQRVIWFILGVIWVTFTLRGKIMVT